MPKYTPETARMKAESLTKPLIRNGFNQTMVAKQEGVTPQAINQRLKHKPVQDALQRYINSPQLKKRLIQVSELALKATDSRYKKNKQGKMVLKIVPDHDARHKYWHDLITAGGILKNDGGGVKVINIIHAYRNRPPVSPIRDEEQRS
jgi:hypothetical protein